jgi:hypothetical protein
MDWVVVCQHDTTRLAYVYHSPVAATDAPVAKLKLSGWTPSDEGCEGWIMIAGSPWIRRLWKKAAAARAAKLTRTFHAGIRDGICDGGVQFIWYWTGRRWIRLPG